MRSSLRYNRPGATIVLMLMLMVVFFIFIAFAIDVGRIQLAQLKLQSAADLSARAGAEALARGVGDPTDLNSFEAAIRDEVDMIMKKNDLFGASVTFDPNSQISFGTAQQPNDGGTGSQGQGQGQGLQSRPGSRQRFVADQGGNLTFSTNSIEVLPDVDQFPIVFGPFVKRDGVDLHARAVARVQDRDIVLVVDKSTSMLENNAGTMLFSEYDANLFDLEDALYQVGDRFHPDTEDTNATNVRTTEFEVDEATGILKLNKMQALKLAILRFRETIDESPSNEQLGITAYSPAADRPENAPEPVGPVDIADGLSDAVREQLVGDGITKKDAATEVYASFLEDRNSGYDNFDRAYLGMRWFGGTNITHGIEVGREILFHENHRAYATPVLLLMTDGLHNRDEPGVAESPIEAARDTMAAHPETLIYTITFSDRADQDGMKEIARIGNGRHFHATNVADLVDIFEELASTAGVTIIE